MTTHPFRHAIHFGLAALLSAILACSAAHSQGTRAELDQMKAQLAQKPADAALREKVIRLAASLNPPPAVPEEARRFFVRGNTALQDAKGPADYDRAAAHYAGALRIAPWFADAYFNQAKAFELRQRFSDAIAALRWYLLAAPGAGDARAAQDKIYALEEKQEAIKRVPAKPTAPPANKPAATIRPGTTIEGTWRYEDQDFSLAKVIRRTGNQYSLAASNKGVAVNERIVSASETNMTTHTDQGYVQHPPGQAHSICIYRLTNGGQTLEQATCQWYVNGVMAGNSASVHRAFRRVQ